MKSESVFEIIYTVKIIMQKNYLTFGEHALGHTALKIFSTIIDVWVKLIQGVTRRLIL